MTKPYVRLDKNDAAVLLVDHQAGLLSLIGISNPISLKITCWRWATWLSISTYLRTRTTSFETGPNGPLVPELKAQFPDAPYIARPGNITPGITKIL